jgi:hypothetical protein
MAGYCKIAFKEISDAEALVKNCRRCTLYVPNGCFKCCDFKPIIGR